MMRVESKTEEIKGREEGKGREEREEGKGEGRGEELMNDRAVLF